MVFDGQPATFTTCAHCLVGRRWMARECGGSMYGGGTEESGLGGELRKHADEYPAARFGLLRLYVGMRRHWASYTGVGMMPAQPMPPSVHGHL